MLRLLTLCTFFLVSLSFGVLAPLGFKLGEVTLGDLKEKFGETLTYIGKEDYTGYDTYRVSGAYVDLGGVVEMKAIVNPEGKLVAMELTFRRGEDDTVLNNILYVLSQKYKLLLKETPEKGDWYLEFADGESRVSVVRKKRSPVFTVIYASPEYLKLFSAEREKRRKKLERELKRKL